MQGWACRYYSSAVEGDPRPLAQTTGLWPIYTNLLWLEIDRNIWTQGPCREVHCVLVHCTLTALRVSCFSTVQYSAEQYETE